MQRPQKLQIIIGTVATMMAISKAVDLYSQPARAVDLVALSAFALLAGLMWGRLIEHHKITQSI